MLWNYLKIAWRTLRRNTTYAVINVVGLALGIACCILLALFVRSEWTYDRFHEKADRIARVNRIAPEPSGDRTTAAVTPAPMAAALAHSFPEVEAAVRVVDGTVQVERADQRFEADALYADSTFLDVFTFETQRGAPRNGLARPEGAVLTARTARTYFGDADPVGQPLAVRIEDEVVEVTVAGVVETPPTRSSLQFDVLLPFDLYAYNYAGMIRQVIFERWDVSIVTTFALLRAADQRAALDAKLDAFAAERFGAPEAEEGVRAFGLDTEASGIELALQPLTAIHLNPDIPSGSLEPPTDPVYSYLLAGAALLVLLIAGINFTTLALGRSARRAKEVGVRKALGARRGQVRGQFWGEALLTSGAALGLGLGLAALFLPTFNQMAGTSLSFDLTPAVALGLVGLAVMVGLVAGSYPALVLSRFAPTSILRGMAQVGGRSRLVRGLVVVQFALSTVLVVGALVMNEQLDYMQRDLGFRTDEVVQITELGSTGDGRDLYRAFREEAQRDPGVRRMATSTFAFFGGGMQVPLALGDTAQVTSTVVPVDTSFLDMMDIALLEGRGFDAERTDRSAVVVNEAFVQAMGWSSAVGRSVDLSESSMVGRALGTIDIIGVAENIHTRSMRQRIQPVMWISNAVFGGGVGAIYVQIQPGRVGATLDALQQAWTAVAPNRPFQYNFLDAVVDEAYQAERRWQSIVQYAAGFALLIACFGLFGLAALAVAQRTKEVGIRKVLGASVASILLLFSTDFLKLTAGAVALAAPVAYWGAQQWLQSFAYRIDLGPAIFLVAGGIVAAVALATVGVHAVQAARLDPVQNLRDE